MHTASTRDLEAATGIPKSCVARWMQQATQLLLADGPLKRYNLSGAGRPEEVPDTAALVAYMHKLRDAERAVTCTHLVNFLKRHHRPWLDVYLATKKAGYPSLLRLLQRCCHRHGFTRQKAAKSKKTQADLEAIRAEFAADYHKAFDGFSPDTVINVDETGMTYDMPPHAIWTVRGGSAKIAAGEKNSYRMTAVLAVRANGEKLPIQFIMRDKKGGAIEKTEFDGFPIAHHYAVQEKAWMDSRVWAIYLRQLLKPQVREPSVLLLDNFDPHVSKEGRKIASEEAGCIVAAIPPNATSHVQPLDVGIMDPFKRHLRNLWLEEELIEGSDSEEDVDLMTVPAQKKRLAMIHRAIKAFGRITPEEIRRSFAKAIPKQ
ncbi:hypothetical protein DYB26_011477 [Aphanomyces astaci]|uniref:DDE-1 domain-containing protein n=1 Tax=Aphanomyces astaci TaxID=112090 RepID=A0A418E3V6_APHAT|nr:hypothetical protein DYB26_011477 [Aphanomyces astaci]